MFQSFTLQIERYLPIFECIELYRNSINILKQQTPAFLTFEIKGSELNISLKCTFMQKFPQLF